MSTALSCQANRRFQFLLAAGMGQQQQDIVTDPNTPAQVTLNGLSMGLDHSVIRCAKRQFVLQTIQRSQQ